RDRCDAPRPARRFCCARQAGGPAGSIRNGRCRRRRPVVLPVQAPLLLRTGYPDPSARAFVGRRRNPGGQQAIPCSRACHRRRFTADRGGELLEDTELLCGPLLLRSALRYTEERELAIVVAPGGTAVAAHLEILLPHRGRPQ